MAKTTPRKKQKQTTPKRRWREPVVRVAVYAVLVALFCAAGWMAAAAGWDALTRRPEFALDLQAFSLSGSPPWVKEATMTRELRDYLVSLPPQVSLFEPGVAAAVHAELSNCPWLLEVTQVSRRLPNTLTLAAVFRRPTGTVFWNGRHFLVDSDGYYLPDTLFNAPPNWQGEHIPAIVDALLDEPPPFARPWAGARIAVGAHLTDYFRRAGLLKELDIIKIDVTGVGRGTADPDVVLTTARGVNIKWGESSVYTSVGLPEPPFLISDDEKLQMLRIKLRERPGLQGIGKDGYIDLRSRGRIYMRSGDG